MEEETSPKMLTATPFFKRASVKKYGQSEVMQILSSCLSCILEVRHTYTS